MDCSHLSESVSAGSAGTDNDKDDDIQFVGETIRSENRSHPQQSGGTGEHEPASTTTAKFQCQICKESLASFANLHTHLKNVHNATIKLTCSLCGKRFNENRKLIAHVEDHKTKRSNFSETKSKSKRKKSVSNSQSKAKRSKRTRKNKNKADKSTSFTKRKRQRGATSKERAKKSKIDEATEITSVSAVDSDKTNDGSIDTPSTEISIQNAMSPPPPSPSPVSPPQNPTGVDDWGWDTDPQLPQPELSTTLELQPPPDSSSLSVPVITTSPKSSSDADLPENSVFEDYFEPLSPKQEVFDDWDGEDDVSNSATVDKNPISNNVSENPSSFPFQCSKCDLQFQTSDLLQIHQSFHYLLVHVKFRCEVLSCFRYFDDAVEYKKHFTSSHTKSPNSRSPKPHKLKILRPEVVQKPQKILFTDEESDLEDPAEDPLMLIESIPECDTEAEIYGANADPEPAGNPHVDDRHSDYLDGELYPRSAEESAIDKLPFVIAQIATLVEPPPKHVFPHLVDGVSKIMTLNCVKCNKTFLTQKELDAHTKILRRAQMLSCPKMLCAHRFKTNCSLQEHLKSRHVAAVKGTVNLNAENIKRLTISQKKKELSSLNQENSFSCPECPAKVFSTKRNLLKHLTFHKQIPCHFCSVCGKAFKYNGLRERHMKTHTAEETFTCPVADCTMTFTTAREQRKHTQRHGRDLPPDNKRNLMPKLFKAPENGVCSFCSSQFDTESELAEHTAAHHSGSHPFPCPKCDKTFKARKNLGMHLKEVHATVKPFSCPLCVDKHFSVKHRLDKHLLSHPEHHAHRCPICGKAHQSKTRLNYHILTHSSGPKGFPCPVPNCSKAYFTSSHLRRHTRDDHPPQNPGAGTGDGDNPPPTYNCDLCNKIFFIELKYLQHYQAVHVPKHLQDNSSRATFTCELCDVSFVMRVSWARHKLQHDSNTDILCNLCGRLFPTPEALDAHKKIRHKHRKDPQAKEERTICDVCGKSVVRRQLRKHMDRHSEVPVICDVCGKPCKTEVDLNVHKNTHLPEKPLKCKFCPYRYNQPTSIYSHMQHHHTGPAGSGFVESPLTADLERNFPCDADGCSQNFTSLPCLKQHQLYHTGDKVSRCNKCGEKFVTQWDVYIHKQQVHKKRFECEYCKKNFPLKAMLEDHVRYNHTLEEPFVCTASDCDRKFKSKSDLRYHMVVAHTGEYKFECEVCGKKFATGGNFNTHMRVHTGIRDFRCEEEGCEASFKAASLLKKHLYNEHGRTD